MNDRNLGSGHVLIRPWRLDCRRPDFQGEPEFRWTRSRKSHKKSRHGCLECKTRKIKCSETMPVCVNCRRKGFKCRYGPVELDSRDCTSLQAECQLRVEPVFTAVDIRLFHFFNTSAYPHFPVGNDAVWMRRIPAISYQYEYLLHAMLALAGSTLTAFSNEDYSTMAISYRLRAIRGINEALSATSRTSEDGDALLAACYVVALQTMFLTDGVSEFLTLARGSKLVELHLQSDKVDVSFSLDSEHHLKTMEPRLYDLPGIDMNLFKGCTVSLSRLRPLCGESLQMMFCNSLGDCAQLISSNLRQAYYEFISLYQHFKSMDDQQFKHFNSSSNNVSQLLIAHFLALQITLGPILDREWQGRAIKIPLEKQLCWIDKIGKEVTPPFRGFLSWPIEVVKYIRQTPAKCVL